MKKPRKKLQLNRALLLVGLFIFMSCVLVHRLYVLQVIHGESYRNNFSMKTTKTRTIKSTRGNIYDRNGTLLAYNELSYSLTIEDSGTYSSNRLRDLSLNGEAYRISQILQAHGDSLSNNFHVVLDEGGNYVFDVEGTTLARFRADVFGRAKITDMRPEEEESTPDQMIDKLCSSSRFGIVRTDRPYTEEELTAAGLPLVLTRSEILDIIYVRYQLFTTQYRKYMPVKIAEHISDESVAALSESKDTLTGIEIVEDSTRIYTYPEAFASLIGYIGRVSSEDLTELQARNSRYNQESIVGKSGIEKVYEETLQGSDGQETVYVDRFGKVLQIDEAATIAPTAGGNVYLTLDANLQVAAYKILEQRIAGVLEHVIVDEDDIDEEELSDRDSIRIPINDVYNAIFENGVIDIEHLKSEDASETEKEIYDAFLEKQAAVFAELKRQLTGNRPQSYKDLNDEFKEYESYIVNEMLMSDTKILSATKIDKMDPTYLAWTRDETISLKEYLTYAASRNWIDISAIATGDAYLDSSETYAALSDYIESYLSMNLRFSKILFKYMIEAHDLSGKSIMTALYDQGVFDKTDSQYESFIDGEIESYTLVLSKINSLELTPAMLALDPCSGSAVVTDPNSGEVLACVTYPGYDNNRLANVMDVAYYRKLAADASGPFYNKATQQETAPGSTFKLVTTAAGLEERAVTRETVFNCTGTFDLTETPLKCWLTTGHGPLNILGGIQNSCNVFFCNVAYMLGTNEEGNWSDSLSLSKLRQYSNLFNMDMPSGIEVPENEPHVSDQYAIQSSIGQGTHSYTTTQLARYVTTLANGGTSYNLSMVDKITDANGNVVQDFGPRIASSLSISSGTWDIIHRGLRAVIESKTEFEDMSVAVAGKTGTAQESKSRPNHALFICYAPYANPEVAMAVRIGNGYSSTNAMLTAKDILQYYFDLADPSSIITGTARTDSVASENVD